MEKVFCGLLIESFLGVSQGEDAKPNGGKKAKGVWQGGEAKHVLWETM
ncbi:hypothetical protein [Fredinandcohnia sp. 179-A 10B2 NHS]